MSAADPLSLHVFRATTRDFELVRTAIADVHRREPVDEQALATFLANAACHLFVAVSTEDVVGSLNGYRLLLPSSPRPQFLLYEIDVKKDWRRRGVGMALVTAFLSEARASGACEVWVVANDSNAVAMALYRQCGFVRHHRDDVMLSITL